MIQQVLKSKNQIIIFIDYREEPNRITEIISNMGANVKTIPLKVGDYICSDRVCIERKTQEDFINSIIDGRLFKQLEELKTNFNKPIIIVEGNNFRQSMNENAIKAAIASIIVNYEIPIIMTKDEEDTAKTIYWISKKEQIESERPTGIRGEKKPKEIKKLQEHIISGFPGISAVLSKRILKEFGSIKNFMNATEEEMMRVKGVGKPLAERVAKIIKERYDD